MRHVAIYDLATGRVVATRSAELIGEPDEGFAFADIPDGADVRGCVFEGEEFAPPPADLDGRRAALCAGVDLAAEAFRGQFLTPGAGQAMTYQRKEAEARAWSEDADPASFPFLALEASATGATIADVAASVIAAADQWALIGAAIEGARLGAKKAINDPDASLEQIEAAAVIDWASLLSA